MIWWSMYRGFDAAIIVHRQASQEDSPANEKKEQKEIVEPSQEPVEVLQWPSLQQTTYRLIKERRNEV